MKITVDIPTQTLTLFDATGKQMRSYRVSTATNGPIRLFFGNDNITINGNVLRNGVRGIKVDDIVGGFPQLFPWYITLQKKLKYIIITGML